MPRFLPALALVLFCSVAYGQSLHHYVAAVQGLNTNTQEKELLHYLRAKDPNGRYVIDAGTGDVNIHTASFINEGNFGQAVNSFGLLLLHFQEVHPAKLPRRKRNSRSA